MANTEHENPSENDQKIEVRIAQTQAEVIEAQKIRYQVFYEEQGAHAPEQVKKEQRDFDAFDNITDHLIAIKHSDNNEQKIVGTYRLLRQEIAQKHGRFYSDDEYNLEQLLKNDINLLELGRSCVLQPYRTKPILNTLWKEIVNYVTEHKIDLMFGCASFQGTDINAISQQLSYLHHFHAVDNHLKPIALQERYINMNIIEKSNIDERKVFSSLPPLIKGYLRAGAKIGDGAVIDHQFNTIDVCIIVQVKDITRRYLKHYERKIQKTINKQSEN